MTHPLPRDKNRHRAMELDFHHLIGRRMTITLERSHEAAALGHLARASAVRRSCGLVDGLVTTHVVDESDVTVIEHGKVQAKKLLGRWNRQSLRISHRFSS